MFNAKYLIYSSLRFSKEEILSLILLVAMATSFAWNKFFLIIFKGDHQTFL
jgi:hypothetical protein